MSFVLTATGSLSGVSLSWSGCTLTSPTYQVQRALDNVGIAGVFSNIGAPQSGTTYNDTSMTVSKNVWYQIVATDALNNTQTTAPVAAANAFKDAFSGNVNITANGNGWVDEGGGSAPNQFNGRLYSISSGNAWRVANSQTLPGTMEGMLTIPIFCGTAITASNSYVGGIFRWSISPSINGYQFLYVDHLSGFTDGTYYIKKFVGGTGTVIASKTQSRPTDGQIHSMQIVCTDSLKAILMDGVTIISSTDNSVNSVNTPASNQFGMEGADDDAVDAAGINVCATFSASLGAQLTPPTLASATIAKGNPNQIVAVFTTNTDEILPQSPSASYGVGIYEGAALLNTGTVTGSAKTLTIPLSVPAQVGHSYTLSYPISSGTHASDASAIAQFEQVPMDDVVTSRTISVIADHFNGITSVTFSTDHGTVGGSSSTTVNTTSTNASTPANPKDSTRDPAYCCTLDVTGVAANTTVTVTAVVVPVTGVNKTITTTFLANPSRPAYHVKCTSGSDTTGDGSAGNPWQTLLKATLVDGSADVYLDEAGNYPFYSRSVGYRNSNGYWMHVRLGAGMTQAGVVIQKLDNSDMRADRIAYHGMSIYVDPGVNFTTGSATYPYTWVDGCDVSSTLTVDPSQIGNLKTYFNDINTGVGHYWVTGGLWHDMPYDPMTLPHAIGVKIQNCYAHGVNSPELVLNTYITGIDTRPTINDHVDGIFWYAPNSSTNGITANVQMDNINGLCIFGDQPDSDVLIRNITATAVSTGIGGACQFGKGQTYTLFVNNMIVRNLTLTNQSLDLIQDSFMTWKDTLIDTASVSGGFSAPDTHIWYRSITVSGSGIPNQTVADHPANITDSAFVPNALGTVSNFAITNNLVAAGGGNGRIAVRIGVGL